MKTDKKSFVKALTKYISKIISNSHSMIYTTFSFDCGNGLINIDKHIVNKLCSYLNSSKRLNNKISIHTLQYWIEDCLSHINIYCNTNNEAISYMKNYILHRLLFNSTYYYCLIPVSGIKVNRSINMGPVTIFPLSERASVLKRIHYNKYNILNKNLDNKLPFMLVHVKAYGHYSAIKISKFIAKDLINSWILLSIDSNEFSDISIGGNPLKVTNNNDQEIVFISDDQKDKQIYHDSFNKVIYPLNINRFLNKSSVRNAYVKYISNIQNKIAENEPLSTLEIRFNTANNLIGYARQSNNNVIKVFSFASAIDSLIKFGPNNPTKNFKNNTASIIKNPYNLPFKRAKCLVSKLYGLRSQVDHGDFEYVDEYKVNELLKISREVVFYMWALFSINGETTKDVSNYFKELLNSLN